MRQARPYAGAVPRRQRSDDAPGIFPSRCAPVGLHRRRHGVMRPRRGNAAPSSGTASTKLRRNSKQLTFKTLYEVDPDPLPLLRSGLCRHRELNTVRYGPRAPVQGFGVEICVRFRIATGDPVSKIWSGTGPPGVLPNNYFQSLRAIILNVHFKECKLDVERKN